MGQIIFIAASKLTTIITKKGRRSSQDPSPSPFKDRLPFSITYGDNWLLNGGSGTVVQSFRLGSINDPDLTGVGGTPTYAAQLAEIYKSYKIESVDIKLKFHSFSVDTVQLVGAVWHPSGESPVSSNTQIQQIALERMNSCYEYLSPRGSTGQTPSVSFVKHIDLTRLEGAALDDAFRASFGANPAKTQGLDIFCIDPVGVVACACLAVVTITYNGFAFGKAANTYTD